jgi:hypothetical protein
LLTVTLGKLKVGEGVMEGVKVIVGVKVFVAVKVKVGVGVREEVTEGVNVNVGVDVLVQAAAVAVSAVAVRVDCCSREGPHPASRRQAERKQAKKGARLICIGLQTGMKE